MSGPMDDNDRLRAGTLNPDAFKDGDPQPMPQPGTTEAQPFDLDAAHVSQLLEPAILQMRRRATGEEKAIPLPWPTVAEALGGGLWPGLHILVGNTGSGRSQFALQAALHAAKCGTPVLYVNLELGKTDVVARLLGLMGGIKWSLLYLGDKDASGRPKVDHYAETHRDELSRLPIYLQFGQPLGWDCGQLLYDTTKAIREKHDGAAVLVVLDFLQLVSGQEREIREKIAAAAYHGRRTARDLGAAVVVVSSTARENYRIMDGEPPIRKDGTVATTWIKPGEGNPTRFVGMGKESGEVEYAADTVLALVRQPWDKDSADAKSSPVHLAVAKVRARAKTHREWVTLHFNGGSFSETGF